METTYLLLADGSRYRGRAFGALGTVYGELAIRAGGVGDLHALTDPVYSGQILLESFPLIGNVGWIPEEAQSDRLTPQGYVVRRLCQSPSNYRSHGPLAELLKAQEIVGIEGIDTRAIARKLRGKSHLVCAISPDPDSIDLSALLSSDCSSALPDLRRDVRDLKSSQENSVPIAVIDLGIRRGMIQSLLDAGFDLTLYPKVLSAHELLDGSVAGIFISPGPGDPKAYLELIPVLKELKDSGLPVLAMGLGHALFAMAHGFTLLPISQGQHGFHRPIRELKTGVPVYAMQNLTYGLKAESIAEDIAEIFYDDPLTGLVQGLIYRHSPAWTFQFESNDPLIFRTFYEHTKGDAYAIG